MLDDTSEAEKEKEYPTIVFERLLTLYKNNEIKFTRFFPPHESEGTDIAKRFLVYNSEQFESSPRGTASTPRIRLPVAKTAEQHR